MTCRQLKRLLWGYVEGTLRPAERAAVEAHLACCERCCQRLQAAQLTHASLRSLTRYSAPVQLLERVRAELPARGAETDVAAVQGVRRSPFAFRSGRRWVLAPALGVLVALLWWWSQSPAPTPSSQSRREGTGAGHIASQEYADTCVELHQQLEMADWAGTPTANYLITTGYSQ